MKTITKEENIEYTNTVVHDKIKHVTKNAKEIKVTMPNYHGVEKEIIESDNEVRTTEVFSKTGKVDENKYLL